MDNGANTLVGGAGNDILYGNGGGHRSAARMEIPLTVLQQQLNANLSQQNVDCFLIENLKNAQKPKPESPAAGKET